MSIVLAGSAARDTQTDRAQKLSNLFRRKPQKPKVTYSVRVEAEMNERLSEIQEQTGAKSINEVFNDALIFYDVILQERSDGNVVSVTTAKGDKIQYDLFPE